MGYSQKGSRERVQTARLFDCSLARGEAGARKINGGVNVKLRVGYVPVVEK
jgi:hypothetical protein